MVLSYASVVHLALFEPSKTHFLDLEGLYEKVKVIGQVSRTNSEKNIFSWLESPKTSLNMFPISKSCLFSISVAKLAI